MQHKLKYFLVNFQESKKPTRTLENELIVRNFIFYDIELFQHNQVFFS